mmetsp:Transcript_27372/g.87004  ORF Transcript_27372/g.87004 Transcript_27372/m.87004 type:complete len:200 (-) Transcript_27372:348-947(-)
MVAVARQVLSTPVASLPVQGLDVAVVQYNQLVLNEWYGVPVRLLDAIVAANHSCRIGVRVQEEEPAVARPLAGLVVASDHHPRSSLQERPGRDEDVSGPASPRVAPLPARVDGRAPGVRWTRPLPVQEVADVNDQLWPCPCSCFEHLVHGPVVQGLEVSVHEGGVEGPGLFADGNAVERLLGPREPPARAVVLRLDPEA